MPRTSSVLRFTVSGLHTVLFWSLGILLAGLVPLAAQSLPDPCRGALPLSLDSSIHGYVSAGQPTFYAIELPAPAFLVVEAHGTDWPPVSPMVRFRDRSCHIQAGNLPVARIQGRHVHWLSEPGTYFVEVMAGGPASGSFHLDAWLSPAEGTSAVSFATTPTPADPTQTADDDPPREPIDEWDETLAETTQTADDDPPREPIDEWDETLTGSHGGSSVPSSAAAWREIPGYGLLELVSTPEGSRFLTRPWCPSAARPGLLSTFTCARRLRLDGSGTVEVPLLPSDLPHLLAVALVAPGWLATELAGEPGGSVVLFDARGRLLRELSGGEAVPLPAGGYYLQAELPTSGGTMRLYTHLD